MGFANVSNGKKEICTKDELASVKEEQTIDSGIIVEKRAFFAVS